MGDMPDPISADIMHPRKTSSSVQGATIKFRMLFQRSSGDIGLIKVRSVGRNVSRNNTFQKEAGGLMTPRA